VYGRRFHAVDLKCGFEKELERRSSRRYAESEPAPAMVELSVALSAERLAASLAMSLI